MPIASSSILLKQAVTAGSAGDTTPGGNPGTSLGGFISTTTIPDATPNALFPDVTGGENAADHVDYQCVFVHNNDPTLPYLAARVWITGDVAGGTQIALAVDPVAISPIGVSSTQATVIANKDTAPVGVTPYTSPVTPQTALPLGNIGAGECKAFWIRRTSTNSAAQADGVSIRIDGDSTA